MTILATWNINSLNIRLNHIVDWLKHTGTDILCLQETKLLDEQFPRHVFEDLGYHVCFSGQKSYNGVAIISKLPIKNVLTECSHLEDSERRMIAATIGDFRVINVYVPNGQMIDTPKYIYKLKWLKAITAFIRQELVHYSKLAVVGDFNIAPEDRDVHDPKAWIGSVMVSEKEREAFRQLLSLGLNDSFRRFSSDEKCFTWWDYRQGCFRRNRGLRIDHILLNESLLDCCENVNIDVHPRRLERPSDHAPVFATFRMA